MAMDSHKFKQLRLLEEISANNVGSQREFSKKLNISLGLVNTFIRRLVNKGYCKIRTIPKKRAKYILTPKGAAEKTKLAYEYLIVSYRYYMDSKKKIRDLFTNLEKSNINNIVFWGAGELAEIAHALISDTSLNLIGVFDCSKSDNKFRELNFYDPNQVTNMDFDRIICTEGPDNIKCIDKIPKSISKEMICFLL